jgi:hypothetical protein
MGLCMGETLPKVPPETAKDTPQMRLEARHRLPYDMSSGYASCHCGGARSDGVPMATSWQSFQPEYRFAERLPAYAVMRERMVM